MNRGRGPKLSDRGRLPIARPLSKRRDPAIAFGQMISLNVLIELVGGFGYTGADFSGWCDDTGFKHIEILPLTGPSSTAVANKWLGRSAPRG